MQHAKTATSSAGRSGRSRPSPTAASTCAPTSTRAATSLYQAAWALDARRPGGPRGRRRRRPTANDACGACSGMRTRCTARSASPPSTTCTSSRGGPRRSSCATAAALAPRAARERDGAATRMTPQPETFARALRLGGRPADKTAVVDDARRLTYAELDALVDAVAAALQRRGDRARRRRVVAARQRHRRRWCCASPPTGSARSTTRSSPIYREPRGRLHPTPGRERGVRRQPDDDRPRRAAGTATRPPSRSTSTRRASSLYTSGSTADPKGVAALRPHVARRVRGAGGATTASPRTRCS